MDWWSFGVLIFEMLTGCSPFSGSTEEELYKEIVVAPLYYPPSISIDAVDCIKLFLERDPTKRLGMKTSPHGRIRDQKFFSQVNWDQIESKEVQPPFKPTIVRQIFAYTLNLTQIKHFSFFFIRIHQAT